MSDITTGLPVTYSVEEVAKTLGMSPRWLRELTRTNPEDYPCRRLGRKVIRFAAEDVDHILAAHRSSATPEQPVDAWGRKRRSA